MKTLRKEVYQRLWVPADVARAPRLRLVLLSWFVLALRAESKQDQNEAAPAPHFLG
jgi:hypothetical protein